MALDERKVSLISEFLEQSFVGCAVYDHELSDRMAQLYEIVDDTSDKILHRVFVSHGFLDDHAEAQIVPALESLDLIASLMMAGRRRVVVRSEAIEIEMEEDA